MPEPLRRNSQMASIILSTQQRVIRHPLVPDPGRGARVLSVDKTTSLLSWRLYLVLKWMINKKRDQYMMSGKGSVTTKNKGRQGERGTERGEGCFEVFKIPCEWPWFTYLTMGMLLEWMDWEGPSEPSVPSFCGYARQWLDIPYSLWKLQAVIIWSWREICMKQRPGKVGAILGETRPQGSLSQMVWK